MFLNLFCKPQKPLTTYGFTKFVDCHLSLSAHTCCRSSQERNNSQLFIFFGKYEKKVRNLLPTQNTCSSSATTINTEVVYKPICQINWAAINCLKLLSLTRQYIYIKSQLVSNPMLKRGECARANNLRD